MITKVVHVLMVLAIFNPFCCCTAGIFAVDEVASGAVAHCVCQSQESNTSDSGRSDSGHHSADCPHRALQDYEASLAKHTTASHYAATILPVLLTVAELSLAVPLSESHNSVSSATAASPPAVALSQVYCVYRI